jgi:hypothetical protein
MLAWSATTIGVRNKRSRCEGLSFLVPQHRNEADRPSSDTAKGFYFGSYSEQEVGSESSLRPRSGHLRSRGWIAAQPPDLDSCAFHVPRSGTTGFTRGIIPPAKHRFRKPIADIHRICDRVTAQRARPSRDYNAATRHGPRDFDWRGLRFAPPTATRMTPLARLDSC